MLCSIYRALSAVDISRRYAEILGALFHFHEPHARFCFTLSKNKKKKKNAKKYKKNDNDTDLHLDRNGDKVFRCL